MRSAFLLNLLVLHLEGHPGCERTPKSGARLQLGRFRYLRLLRGRKAEDLT